MQIMKFKIIASCIKCDSEMARNQGKKENRKCYVTFFSERKKHTSSLQEIKSLPFLKSEIKWDITLGQSFLYLCISWTYKISKSFPRGRQHRDANPSPLLLSTVIISQKEWILTAKMRKDKPLNKRNPLQVRMAHRRTHPHTCTYTPKLPVKIQT